MVFYREDVEKIEEILDQCRKDCKARCVLLVDKDGHVVTKSGIRFAAATLYKSGHWERMHVSIVRERTLLVIIAPGHSRVPLPARQAAPGLHRSSTRSRPG